MILVMKEVNMGVTSLPSGKYRARYQKNGNRINVGVYDTKREAKAALEQARNPILKNEPVSFEPTGDEKIHTPNLHKKSKIKTFFSWLNRSH